MRIFGITYADGQTTEYEPYRNRAADKTWRFEYNPMIDITDNLVGDMPDDALLGILSWKFPQKTGLTRVHLLAALDRAAGADVVNFTPDVSAWGSFMDSSVARHGELLRDLVKACCTHTGMSYVNDPAHVFYSNQFVARKSAYMDYMSNVIKPSLALLEGPLWAVANQPSGHSGLSPEELKKHTGLAFYNYIPFVLERMVAQFVHNRRLRLFR